MGLLELLCSFAFRRWGCFAAALRRESVFAAFMWGCFTLVYSTERGAAQRCEQRHVIVVPMTAILNGQILVSLSRDASSWTIVSFSNCCRSCGVFCVARDINSTIVITRALARDAWCMYIYIYCTQPSGLAPSCFSAIYTNQC